MTVKSAVTVNAIAAEVLPPSSAQNAKPSLNAQRKALGIREATIKALEWKVDNAASYVDAAAKFGLSEENLRRAIDRSGVRDYLDARCEARLIELRSRAVQKVADLMDGRSEYVQLEAARTVLAETKKSESGAAGNITIEFVL